METKKQITVINTQGGNVLTVQAVTPTINEVEQPQEIGLLIDDNHYTALTVPEANKLMRGLRKHIKQIRTNEKNIRIH